MTPVKYNGRMVSRTVIILICVGCVLGLVGLTVLGQEAFRTVRDARKAGVSLWAHLRATGRSQLPESQEDAQAGRSWLARSVGSIDWPLVLLLLIALLLRVLWVVLIQPPSWEIYRDSIAYDRMGGLLVSSGTLSLSEAGVPVPSAFYTPGYPLFIAAVYAVFGTGAGRESALYLAQAVVSVITLFAIYRIGLRMYGRKVALLAVAIGALYWPFVMANNLALTEVLFMLVLSFLVLAAVRLLQSASWWNAALFGLLLGLCCLVRPVVVLWGVAPFLFLLKKVPFRRLTLMGGLALLVFSLVMSPWWVRNAEAFGRFVPFNTSSANPLLVGTHYGFPGDTGITEDVFDIVSDSPEEELAKNARWQSQAIQRLKDQLRDEPGNLLKQRYELTRVALTWPYDLILWRIPQWAWDASIIAQTTLILLALAGFVLNYRSRRSWMLFTLVVYFLAAHVIILIFNRYLFPVMPVIILAAAYAIVTILTLPRTARMPLPDQMAG